MNHVYRNLKNLEMDTLHVQRHILLTSILLCISLFASAQIYGPEQIPTGNFGTIATEGKNDGGGVGYNIYPDVKGIGDAIPYYYQPAQQVYHNGNLVYLDVNPAVTIGEANPRKNVL